MNQDISNVLREWPYDPARINARLVEGEDGVHRLQVRVDLGILQMELEGRPDGQRPHGSPSLLEYFEDRIERGEDADEPGAGEERSSDDTNASGAGIGDDSGDDAPGSGEGTSGARRPLTSDECRALREEAVQFYHRYVALMALEDHERVVRDTTRNLRVLDLCREHGPTEADRTVLEQFRAYILMVRTQALARLHLAEEQTKAAVLAIDDGLEALRVAFTEAGEPHLLADAPEARMLRAMRDALAPRLPVSQAGELRSRLEQAVRAENYELAAILRDELRLLETQEPAPKDRGGGGGPGPGSGSGPRPERGEGA